MEKARAESISVEDLLGKVKSAVEGALRGHGQLDAADVQLAFFPDPGIIGFILRDAQLSRLDLRGTGELAKSVTAQLGGFGASARPAALIWDHGTTVGFFPGPEVLTLGGNPQ